jgi:hypothetical protein
MTFDRNNSKIAITVPSFTFKQGASNLLLEDVTDLIYSEPYLVTVATDSKGVIQNALNFNFAEYLNVRRGGTINMIGNGHLVYGPDNPGDYVAISVLLMESNRDARVTGDEIASIVKSEAVEMGLIQKIADEAMNPKLDVTLKLMNQLLGYVATRLQDSKDKYLFRTEGIFFKDTPVPYEVNRQFVTGNEFADITIQVIPLDTPNGQGPTTGIIDLNP